VTLLAGVLAASTNNSTLNDVEPGLLGFLVVAGIGIVLVFLLRSMNKQFRKLPPPEDLDDLGTDERGPGQGDVDASADGATPQGQSAEGAKRG
jgi:hypothetical protein